MRIYGYIKELVEAWFKKDGYDIKVTPHSNTYTAATTFTLPPATSGSDALVGAATTQTLTNKTINGSNNTLTNVAISTAVSGLGTGVATFLGTPSSANLASAVTDETGTGALVFASSPTLVTPTLGVATATSVNGTSIPSSKTLVVTTDKLNALAATSSAELAATISDETGSGALVFGTSPTLVSPRIDDAVTLEQITTPSNPSSGFSKFYPKSDGFFYTLDENGVEVQVGSGSGSGEKNYVENPSAQSSTDGWDISGDGTLARTTTAANLPREYTTGSALSFTSDTDEEYVYYRFSLDDVDISAKLKLLLDYISSTANFRLEMWKNSASDYSGSYTEVTLEYDVSGDSYLVAAASSASYGTTFDTDSTRYMELRIVHNGTGTDTIYFSDVLVGPGTTSPVPVVGKPTSFTPVFTGVTMTTSVAIYTQIGSYALIQFDGVAAGNASGTVIFDASSIFSGATVDTSVWGGTNRQNTGSATYLGGTNNYTLAMTYGGTGNTFQFRISGTSSSLDASAPAAETGVKTGGRLSFSILVPIAEWAGATASVAGAPAEEFVYNTGSNTGANTSDTTSFGNGPEGTPILAYDSTTANATTDFRVQFRYPVQSDDTVTLEINNGNGWFPAENFIPHVLLNTSYYGISLSAISSTQYLVSFGNQGARPVGAATYAASGQAWSIFSTYSWRVRKTKKASLPYQNASATASGLYKAGEAPGYTGGTAIGEGNIGEKITWSSAPSTQSVSGTLADWTNASLPLTAGIWDVFASVQVMVQTGTTLLSTCSITVSITDSSNNIVQEMEKLFYVGTPAANASTGYTCIPFYFQAVLSGDVTYKIRAQRADSGSAGSASIINQSGQRSQFYAVRRA